MNSASPITRVLISGSRAELEACLQQWRTDGWRIERRVPRVVEGPTFGLLVVLRRVPVPNHWTDRSRAEDPPRAIRQPRPSSRSPLPSSQADVSLVRPKRASADHRRE